MAKQIHSGELRNKVVFKRPESSLNDQGEKVITYPGSDDITTWAKVDRFNMNRVSEAYADTLNGALDFTIRHSSGREDIAKDWLIQYRGEQYAIHEIERIYQRDKFLRFTAKSSGVVEESQSAQVENFTDVTFDALTGLLTFTPEIEDEYFTATDLENVPDTGVTYENGEGMSFAISPFEGNTVTAAYFTPGEVKIRWRRQGGAPGYAALSDWNEKTVTVSRLARRELRLWRTGPFEVYPDFGTLEVYNINGDMIGSATTIEEVINVWNGDMVNAAFGQIISYNTTNVFYQVVVEPNADQVAYPMNYIKVEFP